MSAKAVTTETASLWTCRDSPRRPVTDTLLLQRFLQAPDGGGVEERAVAEAKYAQYQGRAIGTPSAALLHDAYPPACFACAGLGRPLDKHAVCGC